MNLGDSSAWYDPYSAILRTFTERHPESSAFFTRSSVKKTIMTRNYSATRWRCLQNFLKTSFFHPELRETVIGHFNTFFNFLELGIPEILG